jgi:hypothetical protein
MDYHAEQELEGRMDFIEIIFGVSPDGGDGSVELIYLISIVAGFVLLGHALYRRHSRAKPLARY